MAKECKSDRLVRQMVDTTTEHIHELKALEANPNTKELEVERWAQTFLKSCLGYSATNGYSIRAQERKGKHCPDLVIYQDEKPIFVVEVKKLGFDLNKSDFRSGKIQLQQYLYSLGNVPYGFLCNGHEWKLYDFSNPHGVVEIFSLDLRGEDDVLLTTKRAVEDTCYELVNIHESSFRDKEWQSLSKEATAFSPESLTRAILSANVIKLISKEIRGEHEYKACTDTLFHKVYDLLSLGLDDTLKDFNEVKQAEFQKYIKSQMRQTRKAKKVRKTSPENQPVTSEAASSETEPLKTNETAA
jgi:DNA-directed RNA polymerase subunit L